MNGDYREGGHPRPCSRRTSVGAHPMGLQPVIGEIGGSTACGVGSEGNRYSWVHPEFALHYGGEQ